MCLFSSPSMPKVETPVAPQASKTPDTPQVMAANRKARTGAGVAPSTLLTGATGTGAAPTGAMLGRNTLLGA